MALNPGEMIRTLDDYGLTGLPTETDYQMELMAGTVIQFRGMTFLSMIADSTTNL